MEKPRRAGQEERARSAAVYFGLPCSGFGGCTACCYLRSPVIDEQERKMNEACCLNRQRGEDSRPAYSSLSTAHPGVDLRSLFGNPQEAPISSTRAWTPSIQINSTCRTWSANS